MLALLVVLCASPVQATGRVWLYSDAACLDTQTTFTRGQTVYSRTLGNYDTAGTNYWFEWRDPGMVLMERQQGAGPSGNRYADSYGLSTEATTGRWEASAMHNPNFTDWYYISFNGPANGDNIAVGSTVYFQFAIINRDGDTITSDNSSNLELMLRNANGDVYSWGGTAGWAAACGGPVAFDAATGVYTCTWVAVASAAKGGKIGVRYSSALTAPEEGDDFNVRISNTMCFSVGQSNLQVAKIVYIPDLGPDTGNYPAHARFGYAGNPVPVRWQAYLTDYSTISTTVDEDIIMTEASNYNAAAGQTASAATTPLSGANYSYANVDLSAFNAGKYSISIPYVVPSTNFDPENRLDVNLDMRETFTVQTPPAISFDPYTLRRADYPAYPRNRVTRGQSVAFTGRIKNDGQAGLARLTAGSSYLTFNDGAGNTYTAYLLATSDSLCRPGTYCWLTFAADTVPAGFNPQTVSNVQLVLNGTDSNDAAFPVSGSNYPVAVPDTVSVQYAPDIRYVDGLTQTLRGSVTSPWRNVTRGETNVTLALRLTNYAAGAAALTAGETITTGDTIHFTDGTRSFTARPAAAVYLAANGTATVTFNALAGDTVNAAFTAGSYDVAITLQDTDDNGRRYFDSAIDNITTHQITVQDPPVIAYNGTLTKLFPAPAAATVTRGMPAQFRLEVANNGGVTLPFDPGTTLRLGDGTDTYSAALSALDTATSSGGTALLTFALATLPATLDTGMRSPQLAIAGTDANGRPYTATIVVSDSITVRSPASLTYVSGLAPLEIIQGQAGVAFAMTVRDIGEAGITLTTGDTLAFGDGTDTFTASLSAPVAIVAGGTGVLTFTAAAVPAGLDAGTYTPRFSFSDTDVYGKATAGYCLAGVTTRVYAPAAIRAAAIACLPATASKGQTGLTAQRLDFGNNAAGSSGVKLTSFTLAFIDTTGAPLALTGLLSAVKIKNANGVDTPTLQTFSNPTDTGLTVTMGGPRYIVAGETFSVLVVIDIAAGAATDSTLAVQLGAAAGISATDSASGAALAATGPFPLLTGTVTVQSAAQLSISSASAMPLQISQGRDNVKSQTLTFACAGGGAAASLASFWLTFYDQVAVAPRDMGRVAGTVTVASGAPGETYNFTINVGDTRVLVNFGGTPQTVAAGASAAYSVYFNVYDTAAADTKVGTGIMTAGDIAASDVNTGLPVNVTGAYPAASDGATVINQPDMNVISFDSMPATVNPGQTLVRTMQVRFSNDVGEPGAASNINGFWLSFQDTANQPLNIYGVVSSITIKDASQDATLYDEVNITSGCTTTYIDFSISSPGNVVPTPPPLLLDIFLNISASAPEDSTLRVCITETSAVVAVNANSGEPLEAFATNGWSSIRSTAARVNPLTAAIDLFRDTPCLLGATTFSAGQRVYARLIGLNPLESHGVYWYSSAGTLMQTDTCTSDASGQITSESYVVPGAGPAGLNWEVRCYRASGLTLKDTVVFTVKNSAAMEVSASNQMPATVLEGQTGVTPLILTFTNSAAAPASDLKLLSFWLNFQDTSGSAKNIRNVISEVRIYEGAVLRHQEAIATGAGSDTRLYINFITDDPDLITAGNSLVLTVRFDVAANTDSSTIKCLIADSSVIAGRDESSGETASVAKSAPGGWSSLASTPTMVQNAGQLNAILLTDDMPDSVTRGQTGIAVASFRFANTAAAPARTIKLSQFLLTLAARTAAGAETGITGQLSSITITWPGGSQTSNSPTASPVTFDFGSPRYIAPGESLTVNVAMAFAAAATPGLRLSARLNAAGDITASDSTAGTALTSGGSFPLTSDTTVIEKSAVLTAALSSALPATVARGQQRVNAGALTFSHYGDSVTAATRLRYAVVQFRDELGDALNVNGLLDKIYFTFGLPGADTQAVTISSDTTQATVVVPAAYQVRHAGDTLTVNLLGDIAAGAAAGATLRCRVAAAAAVTAEDNNYVTGAGAITCGGAFALNTGYTTVQEAASLQVAATNYLAAAVSQGQILAPALRLTFSAAGATVQNNSFTVHFRDGSNGAVNAYGKIAKVYACNGSETFTATISADPTTGITVTDTSSRRYISVGTPVNYDFTVDINASAAAGTVFRLQLSDSTQIDALDSNTQAAVDTLTLAAAPLRSDSTVIQSRGLLNVASVSEMPTEVSQGQAGVAAQTVTFSAAATSAPRAGVEVQGVVFDWKNSAGTSERSINALADTLTVNVRHGTRDETYSVAAAGYDTAFAVDFTAAAFGGAARQLAAGDTLAVRLLISFKAAAAAGTTLRSQITAAARVTANDSNTDQPLATGNISLAATPLPSGGTTIKSRATLAITNTDEMPAALSLGQAGTKVHTLLFSNAAAPPGAGLTLTSYVVKFVDASGNETTAANAISALTIRDAGTGETWVYGNLSSTQTVSFGGTPRSIDAFTSATYEWWLTVFDTAYAGKIFAVELTDENAVVANDVLSGAAVTPTGAFPLRTGNTTLQDKARLRVGAETAPRTSFMAAVMPQGSVDARLARFNFANDAAATGAAGKLYSFVLDFTNASGGAIDINGILSSVKIKEDDGSGTATLQTFTISGLTNSVTVDFGGAASAQVINAGETLALGVYADVSISATVGVVLRCQLDDTTTIDCRDNNTASAISPGPTLGAGMPLASDTTQITAATGTVQTYNDAARTVGQTIFSQGQTVYAKYYGLAGLAAHDCRWEDAADTAYATYVQTRTITTNSGGIISADSRPLLTSDAAGTWTVKVWTAGGAALKATQGITVETPAQVRATVTSSMPATVVQNQSGVYAAQFRVSDTAGMPYGAQAKLSNLVLSFVTDTNAALPIKSYLSWVKVDDGASTYTYSNADWSAGQSSIVVDFGGAPKFIAPQETGAYTVLFAVGSSAPAGTRFRVRLAAAAAVAATDENSGDSLTASGIFPLVSDTTMIINQPALTVTATDSLPAQVSQGQADVRAQRFRFVNTAAGPAGGLKISRFLLAARDQNAADTDFSHAVDTITIASTRSGVTDTVIIDAASCTAVYTVDYLAAAFGSAARVLAQGETLTVDVYLSFLANAPAGARLRTQITEAASVTASDSATGAAITASGFGGGALVSTVTAVRARAHLTAGYDTSMPATAAQGADSIVAMTLRFGSDAAPAAYAAAVKLYSFVLTLQDSAGAALDPRTAVERVYIRNVADSALLQIFANPAAAALTADFGGAAFARSITAGETLALQVLLDLYDTATVGASVRVLLVDTAAIVARDANIGLDTLSAGAARALPFNSSHLTVLGSATLAVSALSAMPATMALGQFYGGPHTLYFAAAPNRTNVQLSSFRLDCQDTAGAQLGLYNLLASLAVDFGSGWETFTIVSGDTGITVVFGGSPKVIVSGETLTVAVYVTASANSAAAGKSFRLALPAAAHVTATDTSSGNPVTATASPSFAALASAPCQIQYKARLNVTGVDYLPATVARGQANVHAQKLTFTNNGGGLPGRALRLGGFILRFRDAAGDTNIFPYLSAVRVVVAGDTYSYTPGAGATTLTVNFATDSPAGQPGPVVRTIAATAALDADIYLDVKATATLGGTFKTVLQQLSDVSASDSTSGTAIAFADRTGDTPIASTLTTVQAGAELAVNDDATVVMPSPLSQGEASLYAHRFVFSHTGSAPAGAVDLTSFKIWFQDQNGNDSDAGDKVKTITVKHSGNTLLTQSLTTGCTAVTVTMPAADRYLDPGETYGVEVYLTLHDTALVGRYLQTAVKKSASDNSLVAADTNTLAALTSFGGEATVASAPAALIQAKAQLRVTAIDAMPDTVAQGDASVLALTLQLRSEGDTPGFANGAPVRLEQVTLDYYDTLGAPRTVDIILSSIVVKNAVTGATLQTVTPTGSATAFTLGGAKIINAGDSLALAFYLTFKSNAPAGLTLNLRLTSAAKIAARDYNWYTHGAVTDSIAAGAAYVLQSDTALVVSAVGSLLVYRDAARSSAQSVFSLGQTVFARGWGLFPNYNYAMYWDGPDTYGIKVVDPDQSSGAGIVQNLNDSCALAADSPAGSWRVRLMDGVDTKASYPFTVQHAAQLQATLTAGGDTLVTRGQSDILLATLVFQDTAYSPGASVALDSFILSFRNAANTDSVNISGQLTSVVVKNQVSGATLQTLSSFTNPTTQATVDFGGAQQQIARGDTLGLLVYASVAAAATPKTVIRAGITGAAQVFARDNNSLAAVACAGSFALLADSLTVHYADTGLSTVEISVATARSDGSDSACLAITLRDRLSRPVSGLAALVSSSRGDTDSIIQPSTTDSAGVCRAYVRSATVGAATLRVCVTTQNDTLTDSATVTFTSNIALTALALGSRPVVQGETDVVVLAVTLTNYATVSDSLVTMAISRLGSISDAEITRACLYRDSNANDTFDAGADVLIDSDVFSGGALTFNNLGSLVIANGGDTLTLFVLVDVAAGATPGDTLDAAIAAGGITFSALADVVPPATANSGGYATVVASNQAPTVAITAPAPGDTGAFDVVIIYRVADAEAQACTIAVEYSVNGGAWQPATLSSGETAGVATSVAGETHSCIWSAAVDQPGAVLHDVRLRLTPDDGIATGGADTSGVFGLNNLPADSTVTFNELMYRPAAGLDAALAEWLELANTTADTVDLAGWQLRLSGGESLIFPAGGALVPPHGYLIVARDTSAAGLAAPGAGYTLAGTRQVQWTSLRLPDTSLTLALCDTTGARRDGLTYSSGWGANGDSNSLQKNAPSFASGVSGNWVANDLLYGTPGHANSNAIFNSSHIYATAAQADGIDSALITLTLLTADLRPVPNHAVILTLASGVATISGAAGVTNRYGQYTATAVSTTVGSASVIGYCVAEDAVTLLNPGDVRFCDLGGFTSFMGDTYISSISGVHAVHTAANTSGTWCITGLRWSNDGTQLGFSEGDYSTVRGNPGSDRRVYVMDRSGGGAVMVSSRAMNPCPWGRVNVADIDGDGVREAVFAGYVTCYATPFWGIFATSLTGSDSGLTNPEARHISPERSNLNSWTPDVTDNGIVVPSDPTDRLNIACSENGDIVIYSGKYAKTHEYFSRTPGHPYMARILRGYSSGQFAPGTWRNPSTTNTTSYRSYYWAEPTWSPDGRHLAVTRFDFREIADGSGDGKTQIFQSEIWVIKDIAGHLTQATLAEAWGPHLVRISPQTIMDTLAAATDHAYAEAADQADTVYFNPQWSRDGAVVTYCVDKSGSFNLNTYLTATPGAMGATDFDMIMRYVGNLEFLNSDGAGSSFDTYAEQHIIATGASEIAAGWSQQGVAQLAAVHWGATASIRTYDLASEAYIGSSGGILFDNGITVAVVAAGDTLASGTLIRSTSSGLADPGTAYDTMVATGVAREFWPEGYQSSTPIMVILHYDAADLAAAGLADGDAGEGALKVFWWNDGTGAWEDYGGLVDPEANTLTFFTTHFSRYGIFRERNPVAALSSCTVGADTALADGVDSVPVVITLRNDDGPMADVTVHLAGSRGAGVDTFTAPSPKTDGAGVYRAYLSSHTPGRTELAVTNLRAIFPDTLVVTFDPPPAPAAPAGDTGLGDAGDTSCGALTIASPPGAFDTFVRYVVRAGATDTAAYARANARALAGAPAVAFLPATAGGDLAYEIHALRRSDSAVLDTGLLRPVRLNFAIPAGLTTFDRAALVIMLLDERDEDGDGVTGEWRPLPTTVDDARGVAWTEVGHFSVYRLAVQAVTVASLNDLVVYPNPWRRDRHANNANPGIKLLLPVGRTFTLSIHTLAGALVERVELNTAGGLASYGYCWDLANAHGVRVASGVYLMVVRDTQSGETTVRKVAIID